MRHVDEGYSKMVVENPLIQLLRTGPVFKKSDGMMNSWEQRFLMITNCGLLYFKKGNDQPQKFKSLNNFIIQVLT